MANILLVGNYPLFLIKNLIINHKVTVFTSNKMIPNSLLSQCQIIVTRGHVITESMLRKAKKLKTIIKAGAGTDTIAVDAAKKRNMQVITIPLNTNAVAELTIGYMLELRRNIVDQWIHLKKGDWQYKNTINNRELQGSVLGIIGFGKIGQRVAALATAFGMQLLVYDRNINNDKKKDILAKLSGSFSSLEHILQHADIISLHLPLTRETNELLSFQELKLLKSSAILINTARANLIKKDALYQLLYEKKIAGAAFDVFYEEPIPISDPLLSFGHVICTPHTGAQTIETMEKTAEEIIRIINSF